MMKHTQLLLAGFALVALMLVPNAAQADTVLTINPPTQNALAGQTVTFGATLANTGTAEVFLNGSLLTFPAPGFGLNDLFLTNSPVSLAGGATATFDLFQIIVPSGASPGIFTGSFQIRGGANEGTDDLLDEASFTLNVIAPTAAPVPEPATMLLFGTGIAGVVAKLRRRRCRSRVLPN